MGTVFNTAQPARDLNPLDATLAQDTKASALWNVVKPSFTTLQNALDVQLPNATNSLFAQVAQINANTRLTQQAKREDEAATRNKSQQAIEALRRTAEAARDKITAACNDVLDPSGYVTVRDVLGHPDPQGQLVWIERVRDAWTRVQWQLDAVQDSALLLTRVEAIAKSAAERGDNFTMSALRQNADAYLAAHNQNVGHLAIRDALNRATAPASTPEMRAAMQILAELDRGWANLQSAFTIALGYCRGTNTERISGLAGWLPGSQIALG